MRPVSVPDYINRVLMMADEEKIGHTANHYKKHLDVQPLVSVVIPAYNEEKNILNALCTISACTTNIPFEIIVVNNNSTDRTEELVKATGISCIRETQKGVKAARTAGLYFARGTHILNADADSMYPSGWIENMIRPLIEDEKIAITYGRFAFLPGPANSRFAFFVYENMADILRWSKAKFKEEAMNVYGCNSGFRKQQCLAVNAYEHPPGANEDGYLALKLREKGFGRLHRVASNNTLVWTVDRHLQNDGGLLKAFIMRIGQVLRSVRGK